MANYSKEIMNNLFNDLSDEELATILITPDGRGTENKKKVLDILLERKYYKGFDNGYDQVKESIGE